MKYIQDYHQKKAFKQIEIFNIFVNDNNDIALTEESARVSSELYLELQHTGKSIDNINLLIACIAIENDLTLVTYNVVVVFRN